MRRKSFVLVGVLLLAATTAMAQDFPRVETAPEFMYVRIVPGGGP
jgi:hypothetical protein